MGTAHPHSSKTGLVVSGVTGRGEQHVATGGSIINPAHLPPDRRDSIARSVISRASRASRAPARRTIQAIGLRLGRRLRMVGRPGSEGHQSFRTLARSACKRAAGDRLWCGTCHDPHRAPAQADKAAFYRARCLTCHEPAQCERGPDCAGCRMPNGPSAMCGIRLIRTMRFASRGRAPRQPQARARSGRLAP